VVADRLLDIFTLLARGDGTELRAPTLCGVAATITDLDGAGIALSSASDEMTPLCTSNDVARSLMNLELSLGEGPGYEASASGVAVGDDDLHVAASPRWLAYAPRAVATGVRAVFGFPIRIGGARFGALTLYRDEPGPLSETQASDAYLMASVIGRAILAMEAGSPLDDFVSELQGQSTLDFRVHQAAGMIAVQGSMSVKAALVLIRAHAFAQDIDLAELADRIVSRATRFDGDADAWTDETTTEDTT
jgi:GAF domain-containing protein